MECNTVEGSFMAYLVSKVELDKENLEKSLNKRIGQIKFASASQTVVAICFSFGIGYLLLDRISRQSSAIEELEEKVRSLERKVPKED